MSEAIRAILEALTPENWGRVRQALIANHRLPSSVRRAFAQSGTPTLEELLEVLPPGPSPIFSKVEEVLAAQGVPKGEGLLKKLLASFEFLTPPTRQRILNEAPPGLIIQLMKPRPSSPELALEVVEALLPRVRGKGEWKHLLAYIANRIGNFPEGAMDRALALLTRGRKPNEVLQIVITLAKTANLTLPLLRKLLDTVPEESRGEVLEGARRNLSISEEVRNFLLERGVIPEEMVLKARLSKELQLKALEQGYLHEIVHKGNLYPEVVVEALKKAIGENSEPLLTAILQKYPVPPDGVRLLLASSRPQLLLRGLQLGLYYRGISARELAQAFFRAMRSGLELEALWEEFKARLEEEGLAPEAVGV